MTTLILGLAILNLSLAHSGDTLDVRAGIKPVIDGIINAAEWADADSMITDSLPDGRVVLYFKENPDTLYMAVFIPDNSNNNNDRVVLYFDSLNNAGAAPQTDDFGCEMRRGGSIAEYIGNGTGWITDAVDGWRSVRGTSANSWSLEYAISYNKLGLTAGIAKCLGFCITIINQGTATVNWPDSAQNTVPNTWADMISTANWAVPDTAGPITSSITISPPNPTQGITEIVIYALVSDSTTGMSLIAAAEAFIDSTGANGTGYIMQAQDSVYDEILENVFDTVAVSGWMAGDTHFVYVHGRDDNNFWGAFDSLMVIVTTSPDTIPPYIAITVPDSGETNVPLNSWIYVTFSEPVDPTTVTSDKILIEGSINGVYTFFMTYNVSDSTLSINPTGSFASSESINVFISPGIRDLVGNTMLSGYWWWFRAGIINDTIGPTVTNVNVDPDIVNPGADTLVLTARITDNIRVSNAEFFIDSTGAPGTGYPVHAVDSFGTPQVDTRDTIYTDTFAVDNTYWIYMRGRDASGNWGAFDSVSFYKGIDTTGPYFTISFDPDPAEIGQIVSITALPGETLDPDSAVVCSVLTANDSLIVFNLLPDSIGYTGSVNTAGFVAGICEVIISGYDQLLNYGYSVDSFTVNAGGEFLPERMVYAWPNPARGNLIYFHYYVNAKAQLTIDVFNLEGKKVWSGQGRGEGGRAPHLQDSNAIEWDISNIASDVYIFRIEAVSDATGERRAVIKKFAIIK